jgi:hypothetical protein
MPDRIRTLLLTVLDSFEKLVVAMHLRAHPTSWRTAAEIASALGMPPGTIAAALVALQDVDIVGASSEEVPRFSIRQSGPYAAQLDALWRLYETDRPAVIEMMHEVTAKRRR